MSFLWPALLLALAVVPLLVVAYVLALRRRRSAAVRYSSLSLVHAARPGARRLRQHLPFALFAAALAVLAIALGRPIAVASVPADETTIILTIDVSGSMCSSDVDPYRLAAAEKAAATFVDHQGSSTRIGIVAFSTFAQVVQAPTTDKAALHEALSSLLTGRRTAIGSAILASIDAVSQADPSVPAATGEGRTGVEPAPVPRGDYAPDIVVLLTDGASNTGIDPLQAAQEAATRGVRVYTIGFGTANGGPFDPDCAAQMFGREPGGGGFGGGPGGFGGGGLGGGGLGGSLGGFGGAGGFRRGIDDQELMRIADATGAKYYPAESAGQLEQVFASLPTNLVMKHEVVELSVVFLGLASLLAGTGLFLGKAWRPLP